MNPSNFDDLTKALASATSRRQALRTILAASVGGLLGIGGISTAFGRHHRRSAKPTKPSPGGSPGNSNCAKFCAQVFGRNTPAANQCTSDAAHNKDGNLCQKCNGNASSICCTTTGSGYCGTGATCCSTSMGERCCSGVCVQADCCGDSDCPMGQHCQSGTCVQNCTSDGGTCTVDSDCCSGTCDNFTCRVCTDVGGTCNSASDCCSGMDCPSGTCCIVSNFSPGPGDQICTATTQCCDSGAGAICEDPPSIGVVPRCCFPIGASVPGGCFNVFDNRCCLLSCSGSTCT